MSDKSIHDLSKALEDYGNAIKEFEKYNDIAAEEFWSKLSYNDKLLAFYSVVKRVYQGEIVDRGTYRHILYNVFEFEADAYSLGMACGYMDLHNSICTNNSTSVDSRSESDKPVIDRNSYVNPNLLDPFSLTNNNIDKYLEQIKSYNIDDLNDDLASIWNNMPQDGYNGYIRPLILKARDELINLANSKPAEAWRPRLEKRLEKSNKICKYVYGSRFFNT
jgi:hypothetical protein